MRLYTELVRPEPGVAGTQQELAVLCDPIHKHGAGVAKSEDRDQDKTMAFSHYVSESRGAGLHARVQRRW